jgi:hypothetical protein
VLGGDAVAAVADMEVAALADAPSFERTAGLDLGVDAVEFFRRKE